MAREEVKKTFDDNQIATVTENEKGTIMLKFEKDIQIKAGDKFFLNDVHAGIDKSAADGKISKDKADELHKKLDFKLFNVIVPKKLP